MINLYRHGGLAERSKAPVSKTGWGVIPSQVQILHPPPSLAEASYGGQSPPELAKERYIMNYFVYILECSDQNLYTGCTENLDE